MADRQRASIDNNVPDSQARDDRSREETTEVRSHRPTEVQQDRERTRPISPSRTTSVEALERGSRRPSLQPNTEWNGLSKQASSNSTFKVTKLSTFPGKTLRNMVPTRDTTPVPSGQPSEEDLFYMLIHKLKRRDEAEAALVAMREQVEEKLRKSGDENRALTAQLNQAVIRYKKQEAELTSQRELIERWKVKFCRLRNIVKAIGDDQESLRQEGQLLKSAQGSLLHEQGQFREQMNTIGNATEAMSQNLSKQRRQLSDIRNAAAGLERSTVQLKTQLTDREHSLTRERNRVVRLESHIENISKAHLRFAKAFQNGQTASISKIEGLYEFISSCSGNLVAELGVKIRPHFDASIEILKSLEVRESVNPSQLKEMEFLVKNLDHQ